MNIQGYKKTSYKDLQKELNKKYDDSELHEINIASAANVKSVSTVRNALNMENQVVSDSVLTKVCSELSYDCVVVWIDGERFYYTSIKN